MAVNIYYADISRLLRSPGEYEKLMEHLSDERCSKTLSIIVLPYTNKSLKQAKHACFFLI